VTDAGPATVTLPAGLTGAAFVFAMADADGVVAESDENNNTSAAKSITIGADLIVFLDVPASVANSQPGATITLHDFTRNDNSAPVTVWTTTRFYLVRGTTLDSDAVPIGSRVVPPLGPSTTNEAFTDVTLPAVAGTFRIIAKADADNAVAESNESNNTSAPSGAFALGPDLVVFLDLPGQFFSVPVGATISIADATKNNGNEQAGPTTLMFFLSADTALGAGDIFLGSRPIPTLEKDAVSAGSTILTLPA